MGKPIQEPDCRGCGTGNGVCVRHAEQHRAQLADQAGREMDQAIFESLQNNGAEVKRLWSEARSDVLGVRCTSWDAVALHHAVFYGSQSSPTIYDKPKRWTVRLMASADGKPQ